MKPVKYYDLPEQDYFLPGHGGCAGCGEAQAIKYVLRALGSRTIVVIPPGCMAVMMGWQPFSTMRVPVYQTPFETSAASAAGIARGLRARGDAETVVCAIAGDGGTYDIGFQSLSGAAERNEDIVYVCLNNEAYMNTGTQKSSATPRGTWTTSTPLGKEGSRKDMADLMARHRVPYAATATVGYPHDLVRKVQKARAMRGLRYIEILSPCTSGWGFPEDQTVHISRLAVESHAFPLYEVEDGERYTVQQPARTRPLGDYLAAQKRYRILDEAATERLQQDVNRRWRELEALASR